MPSISLYTCVRNGLFYDYHVVDMIKHHLDLVDEIIVYDGQSTDGTLAALRNIHPKVKVIVGDWGKPSGEEWFAGFKNVARKHCSGDWCILLDPDEFIPEWEFSRLKETLYTTKYPILRLDWIHFFGSYRVYNSNPGKVRWAEYKYQVHRNESDMNVWGDGSNVEKVGYSISDSVAPDRFVCHHFGLVRYPSRLRQKLRIVGQVKQRTLKWLGMPAWIFNLMPFDWFDRDFLEDLRIYHGMPVRAVCANPREFVRDHHRLLKYLERKTGTVGTTG